MKKPTCTFSYGGYTRHTMCTSVFSFISQGNEKKKINQFLSKTSYQINITIMFLSFRTDRSGQTA